MIRLFRRIRQNFLLEGKRGKYLKYAIGEIVLVVIGILIALQINNWKEDYSNAQQETKFFTQMKSDLSKNQEEIIDLQYRLNINKAGMDSLITCLRSGNNSKMIPFFVNFAQRKIFFNSATSGYKMIQNGIATYISNEQILGDILDLYENDFNSIREMQTLMHAEIDLIQKEFINRLFRPADNRMKFKLEELDEVSNVMFTPLDFESLSNNTAFLNNLLQLRNAVEIRLSLIDKTTSKIEQTILSIEKELGTK